MRSRSTEAVIRDHLSQARDGSIDEDLRRNYSDNLVLLTGRGTFRGHAGLRQLNDWLNRELPGARFDYRTLLVEGEIGFLEWTARTADACVTDGADSYLVRDGRIVAQTIHYTVRRRGAIPEARPADLDTHTFSLNLVFGLLGAVLLVIYGPALRRS